MACTWGTPQQNPGVQSAAEDQGHLMADTRIPPILPPLNSLADSLFSAAVYMIPELGLVGRRASTLGPAPAAISPLTSETPPR